MNAGRDFEVVSHAELLGERRRGDWERLKLDYFFLSSFGLSPRSKDDLVWHTAQSESLVLLTRNRNRDGTDSLEETIRRLNRPESLPVLTASNPFRFGVEPSYNARLAERRVSCLSNIDDFRGTGRLYLPRPIPGAPPSLPRPGGTNYPRSLDRR